VVEGFRDDEVEVIIELRVPLQPEPISVPVHSAPATNMVRIVFIKAPSACDA
jgi:hypothetical protein